MSELAAQFRFVPRSMIEDRPLNPEGDASRWSLTADAPFDAAIRRSTAPAQGAGRDRDRGRHQQPQRRVYRGGPAAKYFRVRNELARELKLQVRPVLQAIRVPRSTPTNRFSPRRARPVQNRFTLPTPRAERWRAEPKREPKSGGCLSATHSAPSPRGGCARQSHIASRPLTPNDGVRGREAKSRSSNQSPGDSGGRSQISSSEGNPLFSSSQRETRE